MHRRDVLRSFVSTAAALAASALAPKARAQSKDLANGRITVAVAGVRGRGAGLLSTFAELPDVDVKYVCDVDEAVLQQRVSGLNKQAQGVKDFRRTLDDKEVDALVLGTPDHWHAIPTIMACQAGKDVYVEKPDGHNILEGRTMVAAARKYGRVVQLGTQARSAQHMQTALEFIRSGKLGRAIMGKAWESTRQGNLGKPADGNPPATVDYDFWLGPAPQRPFNPLRFHGNWRWFFDYGTGDLGNDGVHRLDVARWALEAAIEAQGGTPLGLPRSVSAVGGKHYFDDAQEWPDTLLVSYDYPGHVLSYEMRIWAPYRIEGEGEGAAVYGDQAYIIFGNNGWRAHDPKGEKIAEGQASNNDMPHAQNFIQCMRTREKPNADLETVGHPASMLCHLGNAAWRAGRSLKFDWEKYEFVDDADANQYVTRPDYRQPWVLPKLDEV